MEGGFPRSDRDSGNLYPIYPPFPCSDFGTKCGGGVGVGGGGGCQNIFFKRKTILSHFMISSRFVISNIFRKKRPVGH